MKGKKRRPLSKGTVPYLSKHLPARPPRPAWIQNFGSGGVPLVRPTFPTVGQWPSIATGAGFVGIRLGMIRNVKLEIPFRTVSELFLTQLASDSLGKS